MKPISLTKPRWFSLATQDDGIIECSIYDSIGEYGMSAQTFIEEMSYIKPGRLINLHINSPGGDVFDALVIYNYLQRRPEKIHVFIEGLAASAASYVAMAGDVIEMPENSFLFIHNPWGIVTGDAGTLEDTAAAMRKMQADYVSVYAKRTNQSPDRVQEIMDADTWMTAAEAKALGFCDVVTGVVQMAAKYDVSRYPNLPASHAMLLVTAEDAGDKTMPDPIVDPVEPKPAAPAPVTPVVGEPVGDKPIDARAEFKAFDEKFGERASGYFKAGLTMEQATDKWATDMKAENDALKAKVAAPVTAPAPFAAAGDSPVKTLWAQYNEIKDGAAKTIFYRANKAAMDAEVKKAQ